MLLISCSASACAFGRWLPMTRSTCQPVPGATACGSLQMPTPSRRFAAPARCRDPAPMVPGAMIPVTMCGASLPGALLPPAKKYRATMTMRKLAAPTNTARPAKETLTAGATLAACVAPAPDSAPMRRTHPTTTSRRQPSQEGAFLASTAPSVSTTPTAMACQGVSGVPSLDTARHTRNAHIADRLRPAIEAVERSAMLLWDWLGWWCCRKLK